MISLSATLTTTLWIAIASTVVVMLAGTPLAYALSRPGWRWRGLVDALANVPLLLPPSVVGFYLLYLLAPNGWLGRIFAHLGVPPLLFTPWAAVLAAAVVASPLYIQALRTSLEAVDSELIEAAMTDGATRLTAVRYITLPLARDGVITGALLAFARSIGEFGATMIVAGNIPGRTQTLSLAVYTALQAGLDETAHALSLVAVGVGSLVTWVTLRLRSRSRSAWTLEACHSRTPPKPKTRRRRRPRSHLRSRRV